MSVSVILGLLVCMQAPGSRAGTPVFVLKGSDVQLDISKADVPEEFILLLWRFNGKDNLVTFSPGGKPKVFSAYVGRVEVSETSYSVKLKDVTETDSGVYTARVTGDKGESIVAEHRVTVQAPVSPVTLTVNPVSNSSDSCNLTVTCRTRDSHISSTLTCVNQICSEDGDTSINTSSGAVLHVYLQNNLIRCNHSNQVDWTINQGAARIQDFCSSERSEGAGSILCLVKTVVFSVGLILMTSAVISVHLFETIKKRKLTQESAATVHTQPSHS